VDGSPLPGLANLFFISHLHFPRKVEAKLMHAYRRSYALYRAGQACKAVS
jgi:hypothetical protein